MPVPSRLARHLAVFAAFVLLGAASTATLAGTAYVVSQKGREFRPKEVTMRVGETLQIINDDDDLLHHAYLASDAFSFDSGDQRPGSVYAVAFPVAGHFTVLCGIHPKMRLSVTVQ